MATRKKARGKATRKTTAPRKGAAAKRKAPAKKRAAKAKRPATKARAPRAKAAGIGPAEASQIVKKYAEKQQIDVRLTQEQLDAILKQWDEGDPRMPAQIIFHVGDRELMKMQVAAYRYRGDTCCV